MESASTGSTGSTGKASTTGSTAPRRSLDSSTARQPGLNVTDEAGGVFSLYRVGGWRLERGGGRQVVSAPGVHITD